MAGSQKNHVRSLVLVGLLSALVLVLSIFSIPIGEVSRIHLGNVMCLLAGLLFGPWVGGLAAGIGSMLYDFTNPLYTPEFWITFITKFAMGWLAGMLSRNLEGKMPTAARYILSASAGALLYVVLYLVKSAIMLHFVNGNPWVTVWPTVAGKAVVSGINAIIAVTASVILAPILKKALDSAGLLKKKAKH